MRKINRYIARAVLGSVSMVVLVIMVLLLIAAFVDEAGDVRGTYDWVEKSIYVALTMPRRLYEILPFACLIGCLIGLGILANSSELVVMRAAGISVKRITWMVLKPLSLFIILGVVLGEFVTPYTDQVAESRRAMALGKATAETRKGSMWNREGNEFMRINAVLPNGVLYGVTRFKFDDQRNLVEASFTQQAIYQGGYWQEEGIAITYFEPQEASAQDVSSEDAATESIDKASVTPLAPAFRPRSEQLPSRRWETPLSPGLLNILVADPEALSLQSLWYYINYLKDQNLINSDYNLAFWQKLFQPLATASLVLIAISFIFGPLHEVTMGQRIFTGVVFGVVFRLVQDLLGPSSVVFGFAPIIAVLVPIIFCLLLGVYLLNRTR